MHLQIAQLPNPLTNTETTLPDNNFELVSKVGLSNFFKEINVLKAQRQSEFYQGLNDRFKGYSNQKNLPLSSVLKIFESLNESFDHNNEVDSKAFTKLNDAMVKKSGYLSRFFSTETWEEWSEQRTPLGRVIGLYIDYCATTTQFDNYSRRMDEKLLKDAHTTAEALLQDPDVAAYQERRMVKKLDAKPRADYQARAIIDVPEFYTTLRTNASSFGSVVRDITTLNDSSLMVSLRYSLVKLDFTSELKNAYSFDGELLGHVSSNQGIFLRAGKDFVNGGYALNPVLAKLDLNGNLMWAFKYNMSTPSTTSNQVTAVFEDSQTSAVYFASTFDAGDTDTYAILTRANSTGYPVWSKKWDDVGYNYNHVNGMFQSQNVITISGLVYPSTCNLAIFDLNKQTGAVMSARSFTSSEGKNIYSQVMASTINNDIVFVGGYGTTLDRSILVMKIENTNPADNDYHNILWARQYNYGLTGKLSGEDVVTDKAGYILLTATDGTNGGPLIIKLNELNGGVEWAKRWASVNYIPTSITYDNNHIMVSYLEIGQSNEFKQVHVLKLNEFGDTVNCPPGDFTDVTTSITSTDLKSLIIPVTPAYQPTISNVTFTPTKLSNVLSATNSIFQNDLCKSLVTTDTVGTTGFSGTTGISEIPGNVGFIKNNDESNSLTPIIAGAAAGGGVCLLSLAALLCYIRTRRKSKESVELTNLQSSPQGYVLAKSVQDEETAIGNGQEMAFYKSNKTRFEGVLETYDMYDKRFRLLNKIDVTVAKEIEDRTGYRFNVEGKGEVSGVIGKGQFGEAMFAFDVESKSLVLCKIVWGKDACDNSKQEAEILNLLSGKPGVIELIKSGDFTQGLQDEVRYVHFLEYANFGNGQKLAEKLNQIQDENIKLKLLSEIIKQLLMGLSSLKREHVYHGDLKLANIVVNIPADNPSDMQVKIIDFGCAHQLRDGQVTHNDMGDSSLFSLQRVNYHKNKKAFDGHKEDMWAMGLMTYELATGKNPKIVFKARGLIYDASMQEVPESVFEDRKKQLFEPDLKDDSCLALARGMLNVNADKRSACDQLSTHGFFSSNQFSTDDEKAVAICNLVKVKLQEDSSTYYTASKDEVYYNNGKESEDKIHFYADKGSYQTTDSALAFFKNNQSVDKKATRYSNMPEMEAQQNFDFK